MAAQGAFGTDFYDRSIIKSIVPTNVLVELGSINCSQIAGVVPAKLIDKKLISCVKYRKNKLVSYEKKRGKKE